MDHNLQPSYNPCSLKESEQILPAKIWELLRRNEAFKNAVELLKKHDLRVQSIDLKIKNFQDRGTRPGQSGAESGDLNANYSLRSKTWLSAKRIIENASRTNPFAGIALQWLVPEPLFHCHILTRPPGKKWEKREIFIPILIRQGEGIIANIEDKGWVWRNPQKSEVGGHLMRRGPEVFWTKSKFKKLRSKVNPIEEWRRYPWPFTVEHPWSKAPEGFKREFQYIWCNLFDSRPNNPLTQNHGDSPAPHEVNFFHNRSLANFRVSGTLTQRDLKQIIQFKNLASDYRIFAIPKTILTKASAKAMGGWLSSELKRGSNLYGNLLDGELLDESELLGLETEWKDWLASEEKQSNKIYKSTYFYRRCEYMKSLVSLVFPQFDLAKLLKKTSHRKRGKKYVRKMRNE